MEQLEDRVAMDHRFGYYHCVEDADRVSRRCLWCSVPLHNAGEFTTDRAVWRDHPDCCEVRMPLDMTLFENSDQWCDFRFDDEAIQISDELLAERHALLTPLVRKDDKIYRIAIPDLRRVAFTWSATLRDAVEVEEVLTTPTFHACGYIGFFKPSISEVLAQMPKRIPMNFNAYYIDVDKMKCCQCGTGHLAPTHWVRIIA